MVLKGFWVHYQPVSSPQLNNARTKNKEKEEE